MKKYKIPLINIAWFSAENIVTASIAVNRQYIEEVTTLLGTISHEEYATKVASMKSILNFTN